MGAKKTIPIIWGALACVAGTVAAMPASAQATETANGTALLYQRMDLNGDGAIDANELEALRARVFAQLDMDRDGELNEHEFVDQWVSQAVDESDPRREAVSGLRRDRFAEMDRNRDRMLSREEYLSDGNTRFQNADADGDGKLTIDEFSVGTN